MDSSVSPAIFSIPSYPFMPACDNYESQLPNEDGKTAQMESLREPTPVPSRNTVHTFVPSSAGPDNFLH
jgi:hypothetical protein